MESLGEPSPSGEGSKATGKRLSSRSTKLDLQHLKNQELEQNLSERKKYARQLFIMLCAWLTIMLLVLSLNAIGRIPGTFMNFILSDSVAITLITTTTANIAAFFLVVTKYLFPVLGDHSK